MFEEGELHFRFVAQWAWVARTFFKVRGQKRTWKNYRKF